MVNDTEFSFLDKMYKVSAPKGINKDLREEILAAFYAGQSIKELSAFLSTVYAAQKQALLVFLDLVINNAYPVDADFWLALEAQASYKGPTEAASQYPFLGAFDKSPRHRSQTIDRFEEAKRGWEQECLSTHLIIPTGTKGRNFGEDKKRAGLRINLQGNRDILETIQKQVEILTGRQNSLRNAIVIRYSASMKPENLPAQIAIFKQLEALLFPPIALEQSADPQGLTAEDWVIARYNFTQSSPAAVVINAFDKIYAAWYEQAILTMQTKMELISTEDLTAGRANKLGNA